MRPFGIVVSDVFADKVFEVPFSEYEKVLQAFPLNRSHKAFLVGIKIRRAIRYLFDTCIVGLEELVEFFGEFRG